MNGKMARKVELLDFWHITSIGWDTLMAQGKIAYYGSDIIGMKKIIKLRKFVIC